MIKPDSIIAHWTPPRRWRALAAFGLLAVFFAGTAAAIYWTGGVKYTTIHAMYLPILVSAFLFGVRGGMLAGIIGGLIAGPYMPLDTATHEMQNTLNWALRMGIFTTLGALAGSARTLLILQLEKARWIANHNMHTGLHSRHHLERTLTEKLDNHAEPFYLIVLSIDNFNQIADTFGYNIADKLMQALAEKLQKRLPDIQYIAQYQPKRLAILANKEDVGKIEESRPIAKIMTESMKLEGIEIHLNGIVGFVDSTYKPDCTALELIQMADTALFHAKKFRLPRAEYSDDIETISKETLAHLGRLNHAILHHELLLYYQPKMDFKSLKCIGAEVLLRWNSPTHGFIPPDKFIPQAEQSELIQPLTRWVIEESFKQQKLWINQGLNLKLSINLATKNMNDDKLLDFIRDCLSQYQLNPQSIDFEITESAIMDDPQKTIDFFNQLKAIGFHLSIDDYGKGYASLAYLKYLPIDTLKIDMAFIQDIENDKHSQEITKSTIAMAHGLGLKVVAEGVETQAGAALLQSINCDVAQGYLYGKPMSRDSFEAFFKDHRS
jgi:diguanylate cyclase (GGDEF)-like protein